MMKIIWWFWNFIVICNHAAVTQEQTQARNDPVTCVNISSVQYNNRNLRYMNCMCDEKCGIYGDCCSDAISNFTESKNIFKCHRYDGLNYIYMAGKCPSGFEDNDIKKKCESAVKLNDLNNDLTLDVPVTDKRNNVSYVNRYCAKCNYVEDTSSNLTFWVPYVTCLFTYVIEEKGVRGVTFMKNSNHVIITFNGSIYDHCWDQKSVPWALRSEVRLCLPEMITTCSGNSTETCSGHMQYVHVDNKLYRNEACARCSSIPINSIQYCPSSQTPSSDNVKSANNVEKSITSSPPMRLRRPTTFIGGEEHCERSITCSKISTFPKKRINPPHGNCYCDNDCSLYGDCCSDIQPNVTKHTENKFKCIKYDGSNHAYMVVSCLSSWKDKEIEEKCLSFVNGTFVLSPVTDLTSGTTYGNIFCAICNGVTSAPKRRIIFWENGLNLYFKYSLEERLKFMKYDKNLNISSIEVKSSLYYYPTYNPPSVARRFIRLCVPSIDQCDKKWNDSRIAEMCEKAGTSYVFNSHEDSPTGFAYRNVYCALCNYRNESQLSWCLSLQCSKCYFPFSLVFQPISKNSWHNLINEQKNLDSSNGNVRSDYWMYFRVIITFIGIILSIVFLCFHFLLFLTVESLSNLSDKCITAYSVTLLAGYILFCFWDFPFSSLCSFIAIASYYSFLSAFLWIFVMSFDVFQGIRSAIKLITPSNVAKRRRFIKYSIFCFVVPLIVVIFSLISEYTAYNVPKPMFGKGKICWINNETFQLYFFVLPCFMIIIMNAIFYAITSYLIYINNNEGPCASDEECVTQFSLFGRLAVLMGLTWLSAIFAMIINSNALWILYILLNTTQGVFIFYVFSCRKTVIQEFSKKYSLFNFLTFCIGEKETDCN